MTQKRIANSVDCFCFSFYSGLLAAFFVVVVLGCVCVWYIAPFSFMLFQFLLFLCLAAVRFDMSETPNT